MVKLDSAETHPAPSRARWVLGWVAIPAALLLALFGAGVHVGARHPEMWLSRVMLWLFG